MYDVICFTSNKHLWAVQPYSWLFNKYWNPEQRVIVVGFGEPEKIIPGFQLPSNFFYYSVSPEEYPANQWAKAAIEFLEVYEHDKFILTHEDYWFSRNVDLEAIKLIERYMDENSNVFRVDLTADRLYAGGMRDIGYYDRLDLIEAMGSQYQMSHQATLVRTDGYLKLLKSLPENERSAWNVELQGTTFVNNFGDRMRVIGTRQFPVRYANALLKGKLDWNELPKLNDEDYRAIAGWIPASYDIGGKK